MADQEKEREREKETEDQASVPIEPQSSFFFHLCWGSTEVTWGIFWEQGSSCGFGMEALGSMEIYFLLEIQRSSISDSCSGSRKEACQDGTGKFT